MSRRAEAILGMAGAITPLTQGARSETCKFSAVLGSIRVSTNKREKMTKTFKQFMHDAKRQARNTVSLQIEEYDVYLFADKDAQALLKEARHKGPHSLGGQYSARIDKPHTDGGQKHVHVYAMNNQLFAMNLDGTAHDASHGSTIPKKVAEAIKEKFPCFTLPKDNLIENVNDDHDFGAVQIFCD